MSDKDMALLKFIIESGSTADIGTYRQFDIAADSRLSRLEEMGYIKKHIKGSDSSYAGDYEATGKGYAVLADYTDGRKKSLKVFILTNVLLPAAISWLTAFLTVCMK